MHFLNEPAKLDENYRRTKEYISACRQAGNYIEWVDSIFDMIELRRRAIQPEFVREINHTIIQYFEDYQRALTQRIPSSNPKDELFPFLQAATSYKEVRNNLEMSKIVSDILMKLFEPVKLDFFQNPGLTDAVLTWAFLVLEKSPQTEIMPLFLSRVDEKLDVSRENDAKAGFEAYVKQEYPNGLLSGYQRSTKQKEGSLELDQVTSQLRCMFAVWMDAHRVGYGAPVFDRKLNDLVNTLYAVYPMETVKALKEECNDRGRSLLSIMREEKPHFPIEAQLKIKASMLTR